MKRILIWVFSIGFFILFSCTGSVDDVVKGSIINFLQKLSANNEQKMTSLGWVPNSDPCKDQWQGVTCDIYNISVRKLFLDRLDLAGTLDLAILCNVQPLAASLYIFSMDGNSIGGGIPAEIENCKQLTRLHARGNRLSGGLPNALAKLGNLKKLDISNNNFSGHLPDLSRISGLNVFLAQYNQLSGGIPKFEFSNFDHFNVSYNNLSGQIPLGAGLLSSDSFLGNPHLCGDPLPKDCEPGLTNDISEKKSDNGPSTDQILMYSGYAALGLVIVAFLIFKLCCGRNNNQEKIDGTRKVAGVDDGIDKFNGESSEQKAGFSRSEFSVNSGSRMVSTSMVVLTTPGVNGLKFEDLLSAPAELLGTGKYGSLYKVMLGNGMDLVVKRIKDLAISSNDFRQKMQLLDQVRHPNVLPVLAFYSSHQEKLLVYEYQKNGSLFKLLHGTSRAFEWTTRLGVASTIAEALAFMHQELNKEGIAHGNLKSSNILLNAKAEACISEYGVIAFEDQDKSLSFPGKLGGAGAMSNPNAFKADIYGFGLILLELLTGRLVNNNGINLADWVYSVVREEWTGEVFDKALISEGTSEERMVNLLQVALKCVNRSPEARPTMSQAARMVSSIKEEEEKSMVYESMN